MSTGDRVRSAVRRSRQLSVASLVFGGIAVATTNIMVAVGACGGWLLALIAVIFALLSVRRARQVPIGESSPVNRPVLSVGAVLCLALLLGQTLIVSQVWRSAWLDSQNTVSAAQLRGIGKGIASYVHQRGTYPATLQVVLSWGSGVDSLWAPLDPECGCTDSSDPKVMLVHSSYITAVRL